MKLDWFKDQSKPSIAFFENCKITSSKGKSNGNPKIAINAELLFAREAIPDTSVKVAESPIEPKINPTKNCILSLIIVSNKTE